MPPELDQMNPDMSAQAATLPSGETDREGAMAKADLYKLANYSHKLFQQIQDEDQLEGWVQAKITKAADYIASVYHYLEYEMKFSEYGKALDDSDMLSEGQKRVLKTRLMEAKVKVKELKKVQAEKVKDKAMAEGAISGGHTACAECGGSGMVYEEPKAIPAHVQAKVEKHKKLRNYVQSVVDKNNNGIPDEDEMEEDFDALKKTGDTTKTSRGNVVTKTDKGIEHTRPADTYTDGGDDIASNAKSGKGVKSHAKGETAAEKKEKAPAQKQSPKSAKTWGMKDSEKFDNRDGAPAKPKKPKEEKTDETYGQGVYEAKKKGDGNLANNAKPYDKVTRGDVIAGRLGKDEKGGKKSVKEGSTENQMHKDAERMSRKQFCEKYSAADGKFWDSVNRDMNEESHQAKTTMKHVNASNANDKTKAAIKKASKDIELGIKGYGSRAAALLAAGVEDDRGPVKEAAAAMWNSMKEDVKISEAKKKELADEGGNEFVGKLKKAREEGDTEMTVGGKTIPVKPGKPIPESADLTRMKEFLTRLNG